MISSTAVTLLVSSHKHTTKVKSEFILQAPNVVKRGFKMIVDTMCEIRCRCIWATKVFAIIGRLFFWLKVSTLDDKDSKISTETMLHLGQEEKILANAWLKPDQGWLSVSIGKGLRFVLDYFSPDFSLTFASIFSHLFAWSCHVVIQTSIILYVEIVLLCYVVTFI